MIHSIEVSKEKNPSTLITIFALFMVQIRLFNLFALHGMLEFLFKDTVCFTSCTAKCNRFGTLQTTRILMNFTESIMLENKRRKSR